MTKAINFEALGKTDDNAAFVNAVADLKKRGETLQLDIQRYLVAVAARWVATGDVRPAVSRINNLIENTAKGMRSNAIKAWVETFLGFVVVDNSDADNHRQFVAGTMKAKDLNVVIMMQAANHWYTFTPEKPYEGLNLDKLIAMAVAKADKRIKAGLKDEDNIDSDKLEALRSMLPNADTVELDH